MKALEQFTKAKYLNLDTFRRNGDSMKTPVWFVQEGETLYVRTMANSGKVKRIRNNSRVNIAPCKMDGRITGSWIPAQAHQVTSPEVNTAVDHLLEKKYGLLKKIFERQSTRSGAEEAILEIKISE